MKIELQNKKILFSIIIFIDSYNKKKILRDECTLTLVKEGTNRKSEPKFRVQLPARKSAFKAVGIHNPMSIEKFVW